MFKDRMSWNDPYQGQLILEQLQSHYKEEPIIQKNYLRVSNPPNAGEPIITANVTTIPKSTPTIMKRLFMIKIPSIPVKNGLY